MTYRNEGFESVTMGIGASVALGANRPTARSWLDPGSGRHVRALSIVCLLLSTATASTATAEEAAIKISASPPQRHELTFEKVRALSFELTFDGYQQGEIELYKPSATAAARLKQPCRLRVDSAKVSLKSEEGSKACRTLLAPLWRGESLELAVSVVSEAPDAVSTAYALIEYKPPGAYQGKSTAIEVPPNDKETPNWDEARVPEHVRLTPNKCYVLLDAWHEVGCDSSTGAITIPSDTQDRIAAWWARGGELSLIAKVRDAESNAAWRAFPFLLKATVPDKPSSLEGRCDQTVSSLTKRPESFFLDPGSGRDQSRQRSSLAEGTKYFYLICVDASSNHVVTLSCTKSKTCSMHGDLVDAGRDFVVGVWTADGVQADVGLSGTAGYSRIYDQSKPETSGPVARDDSSVLKIYDQKSSLDADQPAPQLWHFSPRKPGVSKLTVTVPRSDPEKPIKIERQYTIRGSYRVAIRLGLGISWAPWAREVGIQTAADGQRHAAVVAGAENGLVHNELVAGISYFPWEVKQDSLDLAFAIGLRLGVVSVDSDNGWFRSLMIGPELAIGPDLAIGIFGGIHRNDLPQAGYEPGTLLLPGATEIPTYFGVTPAFGVVLNFTPGSLKFFGVTK